MKYLAITAMLLTLASCAHRHQMSLVEMNSQSALVGEIDSRAKTITVTLPSGQVASGKYTNLSFLHGLAFSLFAPGEISGLFGGMLSSGEPGYGVVTGPDNYLLEMVFYVSSDGGAGFAKANDGRTYRFIF